MALAVVLTDSHASAAPRTAVGRQNWTAMTSSVSGSSWISKKPSANWRANQTPATEI
jgi:hypothetical protein